MATKIKTSQIDAIKTAVTAALAAKNLEAEELKVTKSGSVSFSVAPLAKAETAPKTPKAEKTDTDHLSFAYGERAALKRDYAKLYTEIDGLQRNFFGKTLEVSGVQALVIGIKDGKVLVRKENGRKAKVSASTVIKALSKSGRKADSNKVEAEKPAAKNSSKTYVTLDANRVSGEVKIDSEKRTELRKAYKAKAKKRGIEIPFNQLVQRGDETYRVIGLAEAGKKFRLYNVHTGNVKRTAVQNVQA